MPEIERRLPFDALPDAHQRRDRNIVGNEHIMRSSRRRKRRHERPAGIGRPRPIDQQIVADRLEETGPRKRRRPRQHDRRQRAKLPVDALHLNQLQQRLRGLRRQRDDRRTGHHTELERNRERLDRPCQVEHTRHVDGIRTGQIDALREEQFRTLGASQDGIGSGDRLTLSSSSTGRHRNTSRRSQQRAHMKLPIDQQRRNHGGHDNQNILHVCTHCTALSSNGTTRRYSALEPSARTITRSRRSSRYSHSAKMIAKVVTITSEKMSPHFTTCHPWPASESGGRPAPRAYPETPSKTSCPHAPPFGDAHQSANQSRRLTTAGGSAAFAASNCTRSSAPSAVRRETSACARSKSSSIRRIFLAFADRALTSPALVRAQPQKSQVRPPRGSSPAIGGTRSSGMMQEGESYTRCERAEGSKFVTSTPATNDSWTSNDHGDRYRSIVSGHGSKL